MNPFDSGITDTDKNSADRDSSGSVPSRARTLTALGVLGLHTYLYIVYCYFICMLIAVFLMYVLDGLLVFNSNIKEHIP